jgi:hypothetical protein
MNLKIEKVTERPLKQHAYIQSQATFYEILKSKIFTTEQEKL